jgi:hypothetical protein
MIETLNAAREASMAKLYRWENRDGNYRIAALELLKETDKTWLIAFAGYRDGRRVLKTAQQPDYGCGSLRTTWIAAHQDLIAKLKSSREHYGRMEKLAADGLALALDLKEPVEAELTPSTDR